MADRRKVIDAIKTAKRITIYGYDYLAIRPFIAEETLELLKEQEEEIERLKKPTAGDNRIPLKW